MNANQQPEESELLAVITELSERHYDGDMLVYAYSEAESKDIDAWDGRWTIARIENNYETKRVSELKQGDYILLGRKEIIDQNLYSILNDENCIKAREQLFVDVGGRAVPRFQYELLTAAAKKGWLDEEVLETKLREGGVVSSDIAEAADRILEEYDGVRDQNLPRDLNKCSLRQYLLGGIVSPNRLEVFRDLGEAMGIASFRTIYDAGQKIFESGREDVNAFWHAKDIYYAQRSKEFEYGTLSCERVLGVEPLRNWKR